MNLASILTQENDITDSNYTHVLAIVDRSGSMYTIAKEMTAALNHFFADQAKLEGVCLVDYVQFDGHYEKVFEDVVVGEAKAVIEPRGSTALVDAIGKGTVELGEKLSNLPEARRPGKVLVVVVTDGGENSSQEWKADQVKKLVSDQQDKYGWDYVFLGANMDAVATGNMYGFKSDKSMTYDVNNTDVTMASLSNYTTQYRTVGSAAFTSEDRENAVK